MHDIDTTRFEYDPEIDPFSEAEAEASGYDGEEEAEGLMSEAEEEALAAELLGVTNEAEMDQFLGGVFKKLSRKVRGAAKFLAQNAGPLSGALKSIAAKGLPFLTGALGTAIPIPGVGTALGTALGNAASNLLQSEMEQLEADEQEFELSRRFVRLATQAVRQGARRPWPRNPHAASNLALRHVVQRWRRSPGHYLRRWPSPYPPCPPCPPCPQYIEPAPAAPMQSEPGPAPAFEPAPAPVGGSSPDKEFSWEGEAESEGEFAGEFDGEGEGEAESESYETYSATRNVSPFSTSRSGRWVRRGRKIVLYGT